MDAHKIDRCLVDRFRSTGRVCIESRDDGWQIAELEEPRASFVGHVRDIESASGPVFPRLRDMELSCDAVCLRSGGLRDPRTRPHYEDGQRWRVLQVR
jgi:hypothetical protein